MATLSAKNPALEIDPIFAELNLDSVGGNFFIGSIDGVPFRMELVANAQTIGLLFQTRFLKAKQPIPEIPIVPADGALAKLIEEKKAEFTADEDRAWFNLFAAHELIPTGELLPVMREFAGAIKEYVDFEDQPCFACKDGKATKPVYHSEKIHLICDVCNDRLNKHAAAIKKVGPVNLVSSLIWAALVSLVGGVIWAIGWMAFDYLFAGHELPQYVFAVAFLILGGLVALPIIFVFKKMPRRGARLGVVFTTLTCLLTALVGEAMFCGYFFARTAGRLPDFDETFSVWRLVMSESGELYIIGKVVTLIVIWAATKEWGAPKVSLEQLAAPPVRGN